MSPFKFEIQDKTLLLTWESSLCYIYRWWYSKLIHLMHVRKNAIVDQWFIYFIYDELIQKQARFINEEIANIKETAVRGRRRDDPVHSLRPDQPTNATWSMAWKTKYKLLKWQGRIKRIRMRHKIITLSLLLRGRNPFKKQDTSLQQIAVQELRKQNNN